MTTEQVKETHNIIYARAWMNWKKNRNFSKCITCIVDINSKEDLDIFRADFALKCFRSVLDKSHL